MLYGAGRFLSPEMASGVQNPAMAQPTAPGPEVPYGSPAAYQPNYDLFWNPQQMLGAGQPAYENPLWYQSTQEAAAPPEPAPVQEMSLYDPWWSGQMPSSPGVNVMSMPQNQRVLYLNMLTDPQKFQEMGGQEALYPTPPTNPMLQRSVGPSLIGRRLFNRHD